jgi:hypothetical protein
MYGTYCTVGFINRRDRRPAGVLIEPRSATLISGVAGIAGAVFGGVVGQSKSGVAESRRHPTSCRFPVFRLVKRANPNKTMSPTAPVYVTDSHNGEQIIWPVA